MRFIELNLNADMIAYGTYGNGCTFTEALTHLYWHHIVIMVYNAVVWVLCLVLSLIKWKLGFLTVSCETHLFLP